MAIRFFLSSQSDTTESVILNLLRLLDKLKLEGRAVQRDTCALL